MSSASSFSGSDCQNSLDQDSFFISQAKVIILGDSAVGKTSIIIRFIKDDFSSNIQCTYGVDFHTKKIKTDDRNELKMQIWDTAGQEKYRSLITHAFKSAHGAIIVFDMANRKSFEAIKPIWLGTLQKHAKSKISLAILANKCDKKEEFQIKKEEIIKLQKETGIKCFVTSAKENIGISEAFLYLAQRISENFFVVSPKTKQENILKFPKNPSFGVSISISTPKKEDSKNCC